jgi:hypothetical protein
MQGLWVQVICTWGYLTMIKRQRLEISRKELLVWSLF